MSLGHWNWKWKQARSKYSTYNQELLAGMLVLSFQCGLLGTNPIVWLCDQEPVKTFQKDLAAKKSEAKAVVDLSQSVQVDCQPYTRYKKTKWPTIYQKITSMPS